MKISLKAVNTHFVRWCKAPLLPAALLAEGPLAKVVATVILKLPDLPQDMPDDLVSKVFFKTFSIAKFKDFVTSKVKADAVYNPWASHGAHLLLYDGTDLRDMDNPVGKAIKDNLYAMYLPLASQTQFVEAGVKEAKNVSISDRSEPLRSAYAIARSARVHSVGVLRSLKSTKRAEALLMSAIQHNNDHEVLQTNPDYKARVAEISRAMKEEHFKHERVEKLQTNALGKLNKNKKDNAMQQNNSGVDRTAAMHGLFPYGKLVMRLHMDALKTELLYRGCSDQEIKGWTITDRKKKIKELEIARVDNDEDMAKAAALKAFKPLSGAEFPAN